MNLCKDCKHLQMMALTSDVGRCTRITDEPGPASLIVAPDGKWACLYVVPDEFGCNLFEAKA